MMGLVVDPIALGGLGGLLAMAAWAFGRVQGARSEASVVRQSDRRYSGTGAAAPAEAQAGAAAAAPDATPTPPSPCQLRASEERRALFARPVALAELHEQAKAIRRREGILAPREAEAGPMVLTTRRGDGACPFLGRSGQPTCPGPLGGKCHESAGCGGPNEPAAPGDWPEVLAEDLVAILPLAPLPRPEPVSRDRSCRP